MNSDAYDFIRSAAAVMAHYGNWPSFHDADYVAIHIDMDGPTISINFRLYDWDDAAQIANRPNIILLWQGIEELRLSGIEVLGQNAVGQMQIRQAGDGVTTLIQSTGNGTTAEFHAASVEVTYFNPHEEWTYETSNSASH